MLHTKNSYEVKYQLLINKISTGLKYWNDSKGFIEYSDDMDDIYENIEEYNPNKKWKILILFDDMIADSLSNEKLNPIVTELFIRGRKLNFSLVFITQSYFAVQKMLDQIQHTILLWKFQTKENFDKLHLIIHEILTFQDFINLYKKCTAKPFSFLVIDTIASDNSSHFRKNLLKKM